MHEREIERGLDRSELTVKRWSNENKGWSTRDTDGHWVLQLAHEEKRTRESDSW